MKFIKTTKRIVCSILLGLSSSVYSFCDDIGEVQFFPPVEIGSDYLIFKSAPWSIIYEKDVEQLIPQLINCETKHQQVIEIKSPSFLTTHHKINDVIWINDKNTDDIFILYSSTVTPRFVYYVDYQVNSDIYSVIVLSQDNGKYLYNHKKTHYFGSGFDKKTPEINFIYPYKTRQDILTELNSPFYQQYLKNDIITLKLKKRVSLFNEVTLESLMPVQSINGGNIEILDIYAGAFFVSYHHPENGVITGWLPKQIMND